MSGAIGGERWISVYEGERDHLRVTSAHPVVIGSQVRAGREGDVLVGVRAQNRGISRIAAHVTPTPAGWEIEVANRNGAVLHPWGQPSQLATADDILNWPLVGIRLRHSRTSEHWILLSAGDLTVTPAGPAGDEPGSAQTDVAGRPNQLAAGARDALAVVFHELLCWPPRHPATPLQLKQAATRLGISVSALQDRLATAWEKAVSLGMNGVERGLTDPAYLYALVRGGYLPLPRVEPGLAVPGYVPARRHEVPGSRSPYRG